MTPEEIEAICSFVDIRQYWGDLSNEQLYQRLNRYHEWLSGLCDHVKCQATQIAELETQIDLLQNEIFELRKGTDSQKVISELMAQVAALKKIVIGERSQKIYDEKFGHISISHPDDCDLFLERLKIADDEARDRLAKEYPKVDWK